MDIEDIVTKFFLEKQEISTPFYHHILHYVLSRSVQSLP